MSTRAGIKSNINFCYKCNRKLNFFDFVCPDCGTDNRRLKIFYALEKIIASIFFLGFAMIFVPAGIAFLAALGILPESTSSFYLAMGRFLFLLTSNFNKIFPVAFLLFFILILVSLIGNAYRDYLKKKDNEATKNITPASIPSLRYAKKNFKPWQFRFIQIAFHLIVLDSIYSVILGVIVFFLPLSQFNPGWFIAAIFSAVALNFISIPLFIIAYILYFVLLAQVESKKK